MKRRFGMLCALVLACALLFAACSKTDAPPSLTSSQKGLVSEKEGVFFWTKKGRVQSLSGSFQSAHLTQDERHIVALTEENSLIIADQRGVQREIAAGVSSILSVSDPCVFYKTNGRLCRYTFSDGKTLALGACEKYALSSGSTSILITDEAGGLFALPASASEPREIAYPNGSASPLPLGISEDGQAVCYATLEEGVHAFYYQNGDGNALLGTDSIKKLQDCAAYFSEDGQELVLAVENASSLFLHKKNGGAA